MDWIPQSTNSVEELPPPLPPKFEDSFEFPQQFNDPALDHQSSAPCITNENNSAPVLPPKPRYWYN